MTDQLAPPGRQGDARNPRGKSGPQRCGRARLGNSKIRPSGYASSPPPTPGFTQAPLGRITKRGGHGSGGHQIIPASVATAANMSEPGASQTAPHRLSRGTIMRPSPLARGRAPCGTRSSSNFFDCSPAADRTARTNGRGALSWGGPAGSGLAAIGPSPARWPAPLRDRGTRRCNGAATPAGAGCQRRSRGRWSRRPPLCRSL